MNMLLLQLACLAGSVVACVLGTAAAISWDTAVVSFLGAGLCPVIAVWAAGLTSRQQLCKIGVYAILGWSLCFALAPTVSQRPAGRARRIAADPFIGQGWHIPSHLAGYVMAAVGDAFAPLPGRKTRAA